MSIPVNMKIWFEMKEKYKDQISKYEIDEDDDLIKAMIETVENKDKDKKDKDKTTKKKKKKKKKNKKSTDL